MSRMQRWVTLLAPFVLVVGLLAPGRWVSAQTQTPTPDQIELFKNLSPDQQDAVLRTLTGGGGAGGLGGLGGGTSLGGGASGFGQLGGRGTQGQGQAQGLQGEEDRTPSTSTEDREPRIPVMKGQDWVIIEVDFSLAPRPSSVSALPYLNQSLLPNQTPAQNQQI